VKSKKTSNLFKKKPKITFKRNKSFKDKFRISPQS